jgi:HSP20 family protein
MPKTAWPSMWNLGMAQAQMDAIASALMPVTRSPSGRLQVPSIELQETAAAMIVTAFLPGVEPRQVQLRVTPRSLTFYGRRQTKYWGSCSDGLGMDLFQQTIPLPAKVKDRQTQVAYHQGAIVVTLQKARGFWSMGSEAAAQAESSLHDWTLRDELGHQGQRLGRGWRRAKQWLGRRLRQVGNQLLGDQ